MKKSLQRTKSKSPCNGNAASADIASDLGRIGAFVTLKAGGGNKQVSFGNIDSSCPKPIA